MKALEWILANVLGFKDKAVSKAAKASGFMLAVTKEFFKLSRLVTKVALGIRHDTKDLKCISYWSLLVGKIYVTTDMIEFPKIRNVQTFVSYKGYSNVRNVPHHTAF